MQLLLDEGADVNVQGGKYGNASRAASIKSHEAVVRLLLDNGADVNARSGAHNSAVRAASENGHHEVMQVLLDHGAAALDLEDMFGNKDSRKDCSVLRLNRTLMKSRLTEQTLWMALPSLPRKS